MIHLVLDASTAIVWFVLTPEGEGYSRHLTTLAAAGQVRFSVPLYFDVEVPGYLVKKHRQRPAEFTQQWLDDALTTLDALRIDIVGQGFNFALLGKLAQSYGLSGYDVPYFQLAREMDIPIASRDRGIAAACRTWHVERWTLVSTS